MRRLGLVLLGVIVSSLILSTGQSLAQPAGGISLSPALEELVLEGGQAEAELFIDIMNGSDSAVVLKLSTMDFGSLDNSGGIAFLGQTGQETSHGLSHWMQLETDHLELAAGQSARVKATVKNDDSLAPGGHYGAIIVTGENSSSAEEAVAVQPAASSLVLLRKLGGESYHVEIESIKTNSSLFSLPTEATIRFKNTGNVHIVPRGTVELVSPSGTVVATGVINEQSAFVLPGSSRDLQINLTGNGSWLPGSYQLNVDWRFDGRQSTETVTDTVWYVGRLSIFVLVGVSLIIVSIMYVKYRRRPISRGQ